MLPSQSAFPSAVLLEIEVCFAICRSELVTAGGNVAAVRTAIDEALSGSTDWADAASRVQAAIASRHGPGGRLLIESMSRPRAAMSLDEFRQAIIGLLPAAEWTVPLPGEEPGLAKARRRLDETIELAQRPNAEAYEVRVQGALVGTAIECLVFDGQAGAAGATVPAALDLDAAYRLLPWIDRLDAREGKRRASVVRSSIAAAWAVILGASSPPDGKKIDRQLQSQFVDTHRYPDNDWIAWLASRAVDATYAAVGGALGKRRAPPGLLVARTASVDVAAIGRGMSPWDLERTLVTEADPPVIEELGAQVAALAIARTDVEALRPNFAR